MAENDNRAPAADSAAEAQPAAPAQAAPPAAGQAHASPPPPPPPPLKKKEMTEEEKQKRAERLRKWRMEQAVKNRPVAKKRRPFEGLWKGIGSMFSSPEPRPQVDPAVAARRRRIFLLVVIVALVAAFAVLVVPLIPLQIKRTAGFAAFQSGEYEKALNDLQLYIVERPQDHDALFAAAKAALFIGDATFARQSMERLRAVGALRNTEIGFYHALFNFDDTSQALRSVEQSLASAPGHLASHLLRGILLGREAGKDREARANFLRASEIVRGADGLATEEVRVMHLYLQENGHLSLSLPLPRGASDIPSRVARHLGFSPGLDGFIYSMQYSLSDELARVSLNAQNIINYYFVDMLMRNDELQEAGSVLEALQRDAGDAPLVAQIAGFYAIAIRDYAAARAQFEKILEDVPHDPTTINNLATVELLSIESGSDGAAQVARAIALYRRLLELETAGATALANGGYIALLGDDLSLAKALLNKAATDHLGSGEEGGGLPPQALLTRGLVAMMENRIDTATREFAAVSDDAIPGISRYLLATYENAGNIDAALTILEQLAGVLSLPPGGYHQGHFFDYARLLCEKGEWARALIYLQDYVQAKPDDRGARYLLGLVGLEFGIVNIIQAQQRALVNSRTEQHYSHALEGAVAARQGDAAAAAQRYLAAIADVEDPLLRYSYILAWAQVRVEDAPGEVADALRGYIEEYSLPGLRSLLAYAISDTSPDEAVRYAEEDAALNGHAYVVNFYAGAALTRSGAYAKGLELLSAANRQRPGRPQVLAYLQRAYLGIGDSERADKTAAVIAHLAALERGEMEEDAPESFKIHLPRNEKLVKTVQEMVRGGGSYDAVQDAYALALGSERNTKKRAEILYSKATFESYNKTYDKALGLFKRAVQMELPTHEMQVQALLFYLQVLQLTERYQEAHRVIEALAALDGDRLRYRRLRAEVMQDEGSQREALKTYLALLEDYPTDLQSYYHAVSLHLDLNEGQPALELLRQLMFVAPPAEARVYDLLTRTYRLLGDSETSVQYSSVFSFLERMQRGEQG